MPQTDQILGLNERTLATLVLLDVHMHLIGERQLGFCSVVTFKCKMCNVIRTIHIDPHHVLWEL
ncbi:hypothetical protein PR048_005977 [Dryococelus australis]|uniref:Uncharacterized protein n=1 Tax=Dryococelus australis TaxID=614101 RepID=A0ABQ9I9S3_9NEOP|nr:hypothetical protein PR048_005977 [Dryococelus australis]